ncbi:MAG TPA: T9SS type A sorting domain-containing protein [Bacteroidia bacterium]|jgi:hypothetical protein|nr:T9SS type A sorting domain-containing protein [Bacteroidia bacterium]
MKKNLLFTTIVAFAATFVFAQHHAEIGTPQWFQEQQPMRQGPHQSPQNGNDTLSTLYSNTACGLNYQMVSQRLGQRFSPVGIAQPAPYLLSVSPCATILKVYLYTEALGVAPSITATLVDPSSNSSSFAMTNIGSSVDVCWGMNGTHVWRADVTSAYTGPGTYMLSGLPTSATATSAAVDVEGATLLVIYSDPTAAYTGSIVIDDGCHTVVGGTMDHTMLNINACANSTFASAFMLVGDMQMSGYNITMNGGNVTQPQWNWWNEISASTSVTNGQNTCLYHLSDASDCWTLAMAGLYYQTACSSCTPIATNLTLTTTSSPESCNGNGSAAVNVTGGSGNYTYLWSPGGQTTSSISNLTAGTYTVNVQDGTDCASAVVTVGYTGMNLTMSSTAVSCASLGSASVSVTGGVGPYTYSWAPSGGTSATASNLGAGNYTVTVTDSGSGCTMTSSVNVANNSTLSTYVYTTPDSCNGPAGTAMVYVNGGTSPYTYLWSPGGQTTSNITGLTPGSYTCAVTDAAGCTSTSSGTVLAASLTVITGSQGYYSCGDSINLYAYVSDPNATIVWSPSTYLNNPNIANPVSTATSNITYTCTATSACGSASDTFQVVIDSTNYHNEEICFVTCDTSINRNVIIWERWNSPATGSYNIYRETAVAGQYALIGTQPISQFSTFTDMTSNPQVMAQRYKITTVDACGDESDTSYHHRTILLQSSPNGNGGFNLSWNAYEGLPIATYNIYRGTALNNLTLLTSVGGNVFTYNDLNPPAGQNYYLVEAVHPYGGCSPSRTTAGAYQPFDYASGLSNINIASPDGMESMLLQNTLNISPNPNNGNFDLDVMLGNAGSAQITILDGLGQIVHAQTENSASGNIHVKLDLTSLSKGVYFVQVRSENGVATKRLVIQ